MNWEYPHRIVSLAPSVTGILHRLGATARLVGVTRWCAEVAPVKGLPLLGDCWTADAEAVASLKPDLVIGSVPYRAPVVEGMLMRGLRFLATYPRCFEDIYGDIALLARIVGMENKGEQLIQSMRGHVESIRRQAASADTRPPVYCEAWANPLRNCEPWVEELVEAAGGQFVPKPAGRKIAPEEVVAADPAIIVLAWAGTNDRARPEKVRQRPRWEYIRAVKENRIHVVRDELLNTPGPILLDGLNALAAIVHPEIFKGICRHKIP